MMRPQRRRIMVAQAGPRQAEARRQIDVEDLLPILVAQAHGDGVAGEPGIVDQDVDLAHGGLGVGDQLLAGCRVGEIGRQDMAALAQRRGQRLQRREPWCPRARPWRPGHAGRAAMAPPMPPEAPVTSAVLPLRSNMARLSSAAFKRSASSESASTSAGWPTASASISRSMRLAKPRQHLAGAELDQALDALRLQPQHALAPAHHAGHLLDQQAADGLRVADRCRGDIGDERHRRRREVDCGQRLLHLARGRLPSARNGRAR